MSENERGDENLSSAQLRAIEALASGASIDQAAVAADRTPATLRRWKREDENYARALRLAADETLEDAALQLKGLLQVALRRLGDILADENVKTHHLLRAIDMAAGHTIRLTEFAELEERVRALEENYEH